MFLGSGLVVWVTQWERVGEMVGNASVSHV